MNYVVFDLEWNQCPYGKGRENERIPFEIIEIGAVKLNSDREIIDEYQTLIQPRVYRRMHFRTREIIGLSIRDLESGKAFYQAIREFLAWCGGDYRFCTWGNMDLIELQRNMKYYGVLHLLKGPIAYLDVQKLFRLQYEEEEGQRALEYAVDYLGIEKSRPFHRAHEDAWYTAQVLRAMDWEKVGPFYSIDCFQNPKSREEEIHAAYPGYEKYISREFPSKEALMQDREITSSVCWLCGRRRRKKIRWFAGGPKNYYCLASCPEHGWMKGKIRIRHAESGNVYAVKTMKLTDGAEAEEIREKKEEIRRRRRERRLQEKREKHKGKETES